MVIRGLADHKAPLFGFSLTHMMDTQFSIMDCDAV